MCRRPARAQLGRGRRAAAASSAVGAHRGGDQPALRAPRRAAAGSSRAAARSRCRCRRPRARRRRRRGRGRAGPGARSAWPSAAGERTVNVGPPVARGRAVARRPTARWRTGGRGAARSISRAQRRRSANAIRPRRLASTCARASIRTTSQARPSFSSPRSPTPRCRTASAASPCARRRRERVVGVVPRLAER